MQRLDFIGLVLVFEGADFWNSSFVSSNFWVTERQVPTKGKETKEIGYVTDSFIHNISRDKLFRRLQQINKWSIPSTLASLWPHISAGCVANHKSTHA